MIELRVGMRVKALDARQMVGNYKGMIGTIIRADGDFLGHISYFVHFGGRMWGWYLADELEMQERRIGKERRDYEITYDGKLELDHRRRYDRRNSSWVVDSIMYKLKNHYWDSFEKDKELIMKHIHDAIFITGEK